MPLVLQCIECELFQTQLEKKNQKFKCKVCGKSQSIGRVYFSSGLPKECRAMTQLLNQEFIERKGRNTAIITPPEPGEESSGLFSGLKKEMLISQWSRYRDDDSDSGLSDTSDTSRNIICNTRDPPKVHSSKPDPKHRNREQYRAGKRVSSTSKHRNTSASSQWTSMELDQ
jgi:hypothetical protein